MKTWLLLSCLSISILHAQPTLDFQLQTLTGPALVQPVDIASANDGTGRLFIAEKRGTIRIIQNDTVRSAFFLDVRPNIATSGEAGLLGIAFHPNFPATPYVYINYIKPTLITWVSRFTINPANPDDALESSELVIIEVDQPFDNHNAGDLAFGPDGYLYIALGDGGSAGDPGENGQDLQEYLGKMLRIDIDNPSGGNNYGIPADNPFVGVQNALGEIWDLGLRNPWRFSFDRETGDLWIADVGQGIWEEIDFEPAGSGGMNYGWDCYEGNANYELTGCTGSSNYDFPIFVYPHSCAQGPCPYGTGNSITGGFVYRGSDFAGMQGYYICADYGSENIWLISNDGGVNITMQSGGSMFNQLCTFGEDEDGELYAAALGGGFYRVVQDGALPVYLVRFEATSLPTTVDLRWQVENIEDIVSFTVERSTDGVHFGILETFDAQHGKDIYAYADHSPVVGVNYYRIVYTFNGGGAQFSQVLSVDRRYGDISADIYTRDDGGLGVRTSGDIGEVSAMLYAANGQLAHSFTVTGSSQELNSTSMLEPGIYLVVLTALEYRWTYKWVKG